MHKEIITEIDITLLTPNNGLLGFCSFVLFGSIRCNSVAIFSKINGGYRLVYPTKKLGSKSINYIYPISRSVGDLIEISVIKKFEDVIKNDRYSSINIS